MTISLKEILSDLPFEVIRPANVPVLDIAGVTFDSRQVKKGFIFVPLIGVTRDGHEFIPAAIANGATAVVGSNPDVDCSVPYFRVSDTHKALAYLSGAFHGYPARKMTIIGVTGTDGKTTTCYLIYSILKQAGLKVGMISTVNALIGDEVLDTGFHVTTPDAPNVQALLAKMVDAGITHAVIEATSHGLAQDRVTACEFDIGAVTNITHEHLDFHGDYTHYLAAKSRLFEFLSETRTKARGNPRLAILNRDDRSYDHLTAIAKVEQVSYSTIGNADLIAKDITPVCNGMSFQAIGLAQPLIIKTPLVGTYNASNCLAAIGVTAIGLNISTVAIANGIACMEGVPGRMENIHLGQDFTAIVDFAHTPNALKVAIQAIHEGAKGRVIVVFGSAGLRDRAKRRMMAEVAVQMADLAIFTAEDPRTESLDDILSEMADSACRAGWVEGESFWRIADRGEAFRKAVALAQPGDIVMACGKGHEQSMSFGEKEYPWDDRIAMKAAISEKLGLHETEMPWLPTQGKKKR
jgi:UDP-N-acetylmuramoyl-L-alanyl-D-glutamate--2,6-diaminopimelate ligase